MNHSTILRLTVRLLSLAFITDAAMAAEVPGVEEIVHRSNCTSYYTGLDGRARVDMQIIDKQGREQNRSLTILRKNTSAEGECSAQKYFVYFHRPSDVRKMVFVADKESGRDDDRWLYLPALDVVRRIAAGDKRSSFAGSHFFYEDISGRSPVDDEHKVHEVTDNYFVLESTPKDKNLAEFSYYRIWIHKASWLPLKVEYFDGNNQKYRMYEVLKVDRVQGFPTVLQSRMTDLERQGHTLLTFSKVEYNIDLDDGIFNEQAMKKPPRKLLR